MPRKRHLPEFANTGHPQVSPDGDWIAFASLESGDMQVYVRPFKAADPVWQVSTTGGVTPRWRQDGKELFNVGIITPPHSTTINVYHWYAVAPDGQRVLIPRPVSALRGEDTAPITVVLHWRHCSTRNAPPDKDVVLLDSR